MKIAFISTMSGFAWGGSEELWVQCAELAIEEGHEISIFIFDWKSLPTKIEQLKNKGAKVFLRPTIFDLYKPVCLPIRILRKFNKKPTLGDIVVNENPQLICISNGGTYQTGEYEEMYLKFIDKKISYFILNQFHFENGAISSHEKNRTLNIFKSAKKIFFVSQRNQNVCERQLCEKLNNASIVFNPVNLSNRSIVPYPVISTTGIQVACIARLECGFKGQDLLLEGIAKSDYLKSIEFKVNFYGSGPDEVYLKDLVKFYGLQKFISFRGHVSDIRKTWEDNHILILPSLGEGTPLALIEAMLCGRPSIVSDVGGNTEYISENFNGYIIDAPTPKLISKSLEKAVKDIANWEKFGAQSHDFAINHIPENQAAFLYNQIFN